MKVIYNNLIPVKGFVAINIAGLVFARNEYKPINNNTINHEAIHTAQMKELAFIPFYIWYAMEWLIRVVQYRNAKEAYRNISFEREAYNHAANYEYLSHRKHYAFFKQIT